MIKHYLKVAFRNLVKYKTQNLVSIIGLAVGFTCFAKGNFQIVFYHAIFYIYKLTSVTT